MNLFAYCSVSLSVALALCACGSSDKPDPGEPMPDAALAPDASTMFTFHYKPSWNGVQSVDVLGAFGQATDWTQPFVSLVFDGTQYTASTEIPPGPHAYIFRVIGDADSGTRSDTYSRYAFDASSVAAIACPAASPSYSATAINPCSVASLDPAPPIQHITGRATFNGAGVAGMLVNLQRADTGLGSFFADRATTGADGTYEFAVASGAYRVVIQHPQFESSTDQDLSPDDLAMLRQTSSSAITVEANVAIADGEMAFADYAKFAPRTTATLPTTFKFGGSALSTTFEVYGTSNKGAGKTVGATWFTSTMISNGSAIFDGTFTTKQALETTVQKGERYFWGISRTTTPDTAGVAWNEQSMVYPMTWN
jgi:hypothetical protein